MPEVEETVHLQGQQPMTARLVSAMFSFALSSTIRHVFQCFTAIVQSFRSAYLPRRQTAPVVVVVLIYYRTVCSLLILYFHTSIVRVVVVDF